MNAEEKRTRLLVPIRSGGICEAQYPDTCLGRAHSMHHRKNRSQGGTWAPSNIMHVCGDGTRGCHGWITDHPEKAREFGWAVRGGWSSPDVAIRLRGVHLLLLSDSGTYQHIPMEAS